MAGSKRIFRVIFESPEDFEREYRTNLINGGVFVATDRPGELREVVSVEIELQFSGSALTLDGEVVHIVTPDMATSGAQAGVAIQFLISTGEIRDQLEPLAVESGKLLQADPASGRRAANRVRARVPASIDGTGQRVEGQTRDLSQTGVLIDVFGQALPEGQNVQLTLCHPVTGETMEVAGNVARRIGSEDYVNAVAVEFDPEEDRRNDLERFIGEVQQTEYQRRLGGIYGEIAALGPANLISMLGTASGEGTLVMRAGEYEGILGFETGMLRYVRIGAATGMKALGRLLDWSAGSFEFQPQLEDHPLTDAPLPLEAAVIESLNSIDEARSVDPRLQTPDRHARVEPEAEDIEDPSKLESAALDLLRADFSIGRLIDVIPEPDAQIVLALSGLSEKGAISLVD